MKTEVYKKLKEFDKQLSSAVNSGFARFSAPELEKLSQAISEHRGTPLSRQERTCPRCLLKTLKQVAEEYYKYEQSPRGKALLKEMEGEVEQNESDNI